MAECPWHPRHSQCARAVPTRLQAHGKVSLVAREATELGWAIARPQAGPGPTVPSHGEDGRQPVRVPEFCFGSTAADGEVMQRERHKADKGQGQGRTSGLLPLARAITCVWSGRGRSDR